MNHIEGTMKTSSLISTALQLLVVVLCSGTVRASAAASALPQPTLVNRHGSEVSFSPKVTARALAGDSLSSLFGKRQNEGATCGFYGSQSPSKPTKFVH